MTPSEYYEIKRKEYFDIFGKQWENLSMFGEKQNREVCEMATRIGIEFRYLKPANSFEVEMIANAEIISDKLKRYITIIKNKFYVNGYEITCHTFGGNTLSHKSLGFSVLVDGKIVQLDTKFNNELVKDLCCIMGLDLLKIIENIAIEEIKKEFKKKNIK